MVVGLNQETHHAGSGRLGGLASCHSGLTAQVGENNIRVDTQRWKTTKRKTQKEMERWHRGSRWQSMDENGPGSKCMAQVVEAICQQWHERLRWWWWWWSDNSNTDNKITIDLVHMRVISCGNKQNNCTQFRGLLLGMNSREMTMYVWCRYPLT